IVVDHRLRLQRLSQQTNVALTEEAKTIYESVAALQEDGPDAIQRLIDDVCARMNSSESPGHHIALVWEGMQMQAKSHGRASPDMFSAMVAAATGKNGPQPLSSSLLVGEFTGPQGEILVSENRSNVLAVARESLLRQIVAVLIAAACAGLLVNYLLRKIVTKPMRRLVDSLQSVGEGNLETHNDVQSCSELSFLGQQIDAMTSKLAAVERDRRHHMEKARAIQLNLCPKRSRAGGLSIASLFEPADDVGGDYFDVIELSDHSVLLCVADVTGHGVPAAMAATLCKAFLTDAVKHSTEPAHILREVNQRYCDFVIDGYCATMAVVHVDTKAQRLSYANAGHEWPYLQQTDGSVERLDVGDFMLGIDRDVIYEQGSADFTTGEKLILVSDGVTEAFDPDENQFGSSGVIRTLQKSQHENSKNTVIEFEQAINGHRNGRRAFDDTTLVVGVLEPQSSQDARHQ
uniref:PP2C family protein-serine/threonine phosphatase n=1 Tax=Stieleria mannarensis TaxID=2755585 RepID=UPI0016021859